ncbi:MAG: hypothetical protein M1831_003383 [Alyxoria varia]|nr:MAG: hypothetical protein M1831_003383 [Alyxoria varia]
MAGDDTEQDYYGYEPSLPAAIIFFVLFLIAACMHVVEMVKHRSWYFIPLIIGIFFEFVGYGFRLQSHFERMSLQPYIGQTTTLLVAPVLFAATIYMLLGRIARQVEGGADCLIIRPSWLTKLFVGGDILAFLAQGGGGGLLASKDTTVRDTGKYIICGGLFFQLIYFGLFIAAGALFQFRAQRYSGGINRGGIWERHMAALYVSSSLILLRSVVRVVEFLQGYNGYIMKHEVFIYVFDALPMLIAVVIFNVIYPAGLNKSTESRESRREKNKLAQGDVESQ